MFPFPGPPPLGPSGRPKALRGPRGGGERPARRQRGEGEEEEDDSAPEDGKGKSIPAVLPKSVGRMLAHRSYFPLTVSYGVFCGELKRPPSFVANMVLSYFLFAFLCP